MNIHANAFIFSKLSSKLEADETYNEELISKSKFIQLNTGEKLNDFNYFPPGLLYITEGQVRHLIKTSDNQILTIDRYGKGQFAGAEQILRGSIDCSITASTQVEGVLLPIEDFLNAIIKFPDIISNFIALKPYELISTTLKNSNYKLPNTKELIRLAHQECHKKKHLIIYRSDKDISLVKNKLLISSDNVDGKPIGTEVLSLQSFSLKGKLPARLIELSDSWPPLINNQIEQIHSLTQKSVKNNIQVESIKKEALEDWYGRERLDNSFPHHKGDGQIGMYLACLRMCARYFDIPFRRDIISKILEDQLNRSNQKNISLNQLAAVFQLIGLRPIPLETKSKELLRRLPLPSLFIIDSKPIIIWQNKRDNFLVGDPLLGQRWINSSKLFGKQIDNIQFLNLEKTITSPSSRFNFRWFLSSIKQYRFSLFQVVLSSFFVQLLGLFNPLLIQQIIDAVINQGNFSSLNVLGTVLIVMALAQALIGSLRTYLFSDTTNRIDLALGSTIINHLFQLPLRYFINRPVGEISSRIGELEKIRQFLTGTALTVILDCIFSIIYLVVMMLYSVKLTLLTLAVLPFFILLTFCLAPVIKKQLRDKAIAQASVQSHLVESLSGIETIKGQGMELPTEWRWEKFYVKQIQAGFRNIVSSTAASSASQFLSQLSGLIVIWAGALLVLEGKMTIGQLIAFRILSSYVTSPLLRLANLWQNFQETSLSMERLADILDNKTEKEINPNPLPPIPPILGRVSYENIEFTFSNNIKPQLLNINLEIEPGNFVGVVGESGSGKSTLVKLLSRLYLPTKGNIKIDGFDINKVDLYSLRNQIGIVPQENVLFDGNVEENISLTRPEATFEDICKAAKIANAHSFIQELPSGYGTPVGEKGAALSGGQRQRISIARMVLKQPRLLILDEALSSLDSFNEKKVLNNLRNAFSNITIILITHRLNSLKTADKIYVMNKGTIIEKGTHSELLNLNGIYQNLYTNQDQ